MTYPLLSIALPRHEVHARFTKAQRDAKAFRKEAAGIAEFGPKSERSRHKIAKLAAQAEECDAIALSCAAALKDDAARSSDQLPTPDPTREEGVTDNAEEFAP